MRTLFTLLLLSSVAISAEPIAKDWTVEGSKRNALVALPEKTKGAPVIFVWHGHGGTMRNSTRQSYHTHWPEALCIYPQGLNTASPLVDKEGTRPGWQPDQGKNEDRDLKLFDTMLAWAIKEYQIDEKRVFSTGHSNGGAFTYQLWAYRGDKFAAMAPSAAPSNVKQATLFKPKPVIHFAAENDPLVKYEWQAATLKSVKKTNGVGETGKPWHDDKKATIYESKTGTPVVVYLHDGGHKFPSEAPKLIVKFFQEVTSKESR